MISENDACEILCEVIDAAKVGFLLDEGKSDVVVSISSLASILRKMCVTADSDVIDALVAVGNVNPFPTDDIVAVGDVNPFSVDEIVAEFKKCDNERDGLTCFVCAQENRTCSSLNDKDDSSSGEIEMRWLVGETQ